jgi:CelD/BcsL family acetyltransferase involved in cellulose biosynthesis
VKADAEGARYVAFFPLRLRTKLKRGIGFYNELNMAGNYLADYTGLIAVPDYEESAIPAIARHLLQMHWTRIHLENIRMSDKRLGILLGHFPMEEFHTAEFERVNARDNVNNRVCPFVALPDTWEGYLANQLSANTRQKLRRMMRTIEGAGEFRISHAGPDTVERDLNILLDFWAARWGSRKGDRLRSIVDSNRTMLMNCFRDDALFLPVLWKGNEPLGALASIIDRQKNTLLFYIGARAETASAPPPGLVLHGHSIRYAIANGFKTYDFLRGNEPYKYSFGADARIVRCIAVSTRGWHNLGGVLDRRSVPLVFQRSVDFHTAGEVNTAELGYRQVLDAEPRHEAALFCMGQLMAAKGRPSLAVRTFRKLVGINPQSSKAWLWLGKTLQTCNLFSEAAEAYRQLTRLQPQFAAGHCALGNVLLKLNSANEAIAAFLMARDLKPGDTKIERCLENALRAAELQSLRPPFGVEAMAPQPDAMLAAKE